MKKMDFKKIQTIQQLIEMDDYDFAKEFLTELSPEELMLFLKECPDFPTGHLPENKI